MPEDIFPEIDIPVVTVIWQYTGLSTPEMEQRVTTYSEYALSTSVNGIKDIEAQTLDGISVQKIYFQPDVSLDLAIAQIVSATNYIRVLMPAGIQAPLVVQYNASSVPVLQISLSSDTLDDLYNIPVKFANGATVFVKDLGYVRDGSAVQQNVVRAEGRRSVLLSVIKNGNASTVDVVNGVKAALKVARASAPPGMEIKELFDQSVFVSASVDSVLREG